MASEIDNSKADWPPVRPSGASSSPAVRRSHSFQPDSSAAAGSIASDARLLLEIYLRRRGSEGDAKLPGSSGSGGGGSPLAPIANTDCSACAACIGDAVVDTGDDADASLESGVGYHGRLRSFTFSEGDSRNNDVGEVSVSAAAVAAAVSAAVPSSASSASGIRRRRRPGGAEVGLVEIAFNVEAARLRHTSFPGLTRGGKTDSCSLADAEAAVAAAAPSSRSARRSSAAGPSSHSRQQQLQRRANVVHEFRRACWHHQHKVQHHCHQHQQSLATSSSQSSTGTTTATIAGAATPDDDEEQRLDRVALMLDRIAREIFGDAVTGDADSSFSLGRALRAKDRRTRAKIDSSELEEPAPTDLDVDQLLDCLASYELFSERLTPILYNGRKAWRCVAMLYRIARLLCKRRPDLTETIKSVCLRYFDERYAMWIVRHGGWQAVVEDTDESELD